MFALMGCSEKEDGRAIYEAERVSYIINQLSTDSCLSDAPRNICDDLISSKVTVIKLVFKLDVAHRK